MDFRYAERKDTALILQFIRELADYEKMRDEVVADEQTLEEWIFDKQKAEVIFALDDGKYGKGIINNCKTKLVLNLEDEEAQRVKQILHLSETEVMNITHFQRGNGLISTNNNNITVEFKASALEKELITTDRQELLEILERHRQKAAG